MNNVMMIIVIKVFQSIYITIGIKFEGLFGNIPV